MLTTSSIFEFGLGKLALMLAAAAAVPVYAGFALYMALIWREGRRR